MVEFVPVQLGFDDEDDDSLLSYEMKTTTKTLVKLRYLFKSTNGLLQLLLHFGSFDSLFWNDDERSSLSVEPKPIFLSDARTIQGPVRFRDRRSRSSTFRTRGTEVQECSLSL